MKVALEPGKIWEATLFMASENTDLNFSEDGGKFWKSSKQRNKKTKIVI